MTIHPEDTYALVVGVEKYAGGSSWDLDGPVQDAQRFVQWLRSRHVPENHILRFLSPLDKNSHLVEQGVQPATRDHVYHALFDILPGKQDGTLLYFFWGGHGIITPDNLRLLFYADATQESPLNLDLNALLTSLRSDFFAGFEQQIYLVDACANYIRDWRTYGTMPRETFPRGDPNTAHEQFALLASKPGERAINSNARQAGLFSEALSQELTLADTNRWPPDIESITHRLKTHFSQLRADGLAKQTPTSFWYSDWQGNESSWQTAERFLQGVRQEHAQDSLQSTPPSWAGMQDVRLSPLYVFWVDTAQEQADYRQSFDLGMNWGLNRGSFVGIIATCALDTMKLCSYLETVERVIHKAVPEHERSLNSRWWISVQAERFSNGPDTSQEVWHAATEPSNDIAYLCEQNLPDEATPGIIIPVTESLLADKESRGIYRDWCRNLLQRVFRNKELALIFHINKPVTPTVLRGICRLGEELKRQPEVVRDGITVEVMVTERFTKGEEPNNAEDVAPGSAFCAWMRRITRSQPYQNRKHDLGDYQAVLNLYDRLQRVPGTPAQEDYPAQQVVADISIQALTAADAVDTLDRQFLSLVKTYLPERAYALVDSYAYSNREQARYTALYVAADSDALLDAWMEGNIDDLHKGNTSDLFSLLSENDLQIHQASPQSVMDAFVLALMRHYGSALPSLQEHIEECIGTLADEAWLSSDIKAVWKLCCELVLGDVNRGRDPYTIFFQDGCDIERINLIIRAGLHLNDLMPIAAFQRFLHLDRPDPWRLLLAMPPTRERIREIWRSLGPRLRAVLGFCSLEEWKGVYKDEGLYAKLLDCRHYRGKRDLCYRLAKSSR